MSEAPQRSCRAESNGDDYNRATDLNPYVSILRTNRNFRLLFAGRAISYVGTYLAPIAVAFAILDLGGSATEVGLSFAAWTIAPVSLFMSATGGGTAGSRWFGSYPR